MRSGIISVSSPLSEVLGVLTGVWGTFKRGVNNEWLITKTPFMIVLVADLQAGNHELPLKFNRNTILHWVTKDDSGSFLIRSQETHFELINSAHVELIFMGSPDGASDL